MVSRETNRSIGLFACVVDSEPRFHLDALRWFASLTRAAGVAADDLVVSVANGGSSQALDYLRDQGVAVKSIEPFDARSLHCNKIAGALALSAIGHDTIVLTDTDVVVTDDPRTIDLPPRGIGVKQVDAGNPSISVLRAVFDAAGIRHPETVPIEWRPREQTFRGNANGGLYVLQSDLLVELAPEWAHWARWLLDRRDLLARWHVHVDQVAMTMAISSTGLTPVHMSARWNLPVHEPGLIPRAQPRPSVIHYHDRVEPTGLVRPVGLAAVDEAINQANAAISGLWQEAFPNEVFWEWRYRSDPALGSGVGSRGSALNAKRSLLESIVHRVQPKSVLDVGCGDGQATQHIRFDHYVGLDLSAEALRLARAGRPDGEFHQDTLAQTAVGYEAELTICLDVLIHQPRRDVYEDLVLRLLNSASRALIVSGYDRSPRQASPMIHFHEPLTTTINRLEPDATIYHLRETHEIMTLLVVQPSAVVSRPKGLARRRYSPRTFLAARLARFKSIVHVIPPFEIRARPKLSRPRRSPQVRAARRPACGFAERGLRPPPSEPISWNSGPRLGR